jgi:hypothetical protein
LTFPFFSDILKPYQKMEEKMDFNAIIKRVVGIITKPNDEWQVIKGESTTIADLYTKYAIVLAAIPAAAGLLGFLMYGFPFSWALIWAIMMYVSYLVGVFVMSFVIDALAPSFGSQKDMVNSAKVAVYAYTAAWISGIFFLILRLAVLTAIGGLYTLVLLYLGIKVVKNPPQDKAVGYFVVVIIVAIVVNILIQMLTSAVAFGHAAPFWFY